MTETTRRNVVLGAGGAGLAAILTACASYGSPATEAEVEPPAEEPSSEAPEKKAAAGGGKALAGTSDIPEGGGKVFENEKVVVTQPTAGDFKAFSAVCTHAGCTVATVSNNTINCPCHGSKFSIEDGSVADGPAGGPLEEKKISVDGGKIRLA
ncbi:Rieske (2Fe-2S) protein [Nonomuraea sp. KC401]|uniref:Cytochrome bc1 complex Rieske iron-sulfur subunit n=1 Tax=Nonomuraea longispora TaxID=1848320 RepID=A0A4R4MNT6_9ACTN|nr:MULTISPECIES: Rieske (2Fe-2S) protein [Nonomuraea]NBE99439.1 Rieske 2Fe-2S domain-containing protein [Nonomuraea sp. K271]TDB95659.1 Rieske (2Fe-2S) protein [Nonomuraea longispora]TLF57349.1 Rieske (2Fe-2S) protein [Nonomuraea sp. KC401]